MRISEGFAQVISQTVQQVAKVAAEAAQAAFKRSVAHAAAQPIIKGVAAGKSIDRVAGETGSDRVTVIAQLTVAGYDVKVPPSDNRDVRTTVIRDPSTGRTVTEIYDLEHGNYTIEVTEPGASPTSSPLRDGLGRKVTTSFDTTTGAVTTRTEDDLGSGTVVESTRLADGTAIQKTTLKDGTSETVVTAPDGSTTKLLPGQDPTRQGAAPIVADITAGKSIGQIASERGLPREQVIAQLRAAGYEIKRTAPYTENGVGTTTIRNPLTGKTITERDYVRNGTHDVSVTDPSGNETTSALRDGQGRKITTTTDAATGGVTTRTEDDLGSGTVIETTRLQDGTTIEKTIPKGGKPQTVVTSPDGKKTVLAADQTPTRAGTQSIVQDLAQGKSIDQIAKEHGWTTDQLNAQLGAAGLKVATTEPTPDSTQTTITDKHTGKIIANHRADYRHNTENTHYVDAQGNDVTRTVSTNGTDKTTVVGPDGRKTETTTTGGKTTTAVTFNGYTLTTAPDGSKTLTDNATGTELKLKKGSVEEAFASTIVSINPNNTNPEEAKEAKVIKSLLDGIFAGESVPDLLKAAQLAGIDKDALIAKYGPGNGVPGIPVNPTRDDHNNVIDPYGAPPAQKAPSGGTWVAMEVEGKWYWVDSAVAKSIVAEDTAITKLGQAQAKSAQAQAQLDTYMLDPAYKGAVDSAQTTINKVLARYDLEWKPEKPERTLADTQTRLSQANTVLTQVTAARGEYETAAGILDTMIASGSQLRPVRDTTSVAVTAQGTSRELLQKQDLADNAAVRAQFADINVHMSKGEGFMGDSMITLTGTADAPATTLPPGTQPVEITVGGRTIKVAPDVAQNYQATGDINALTKDGKKVAIEVEVTEADGSKSKKWLWADPDLALFKIQSDTQIELGGAYSDFYKAHSLTAAAELNEQDLKQKLSAEYNAKHQFLFNGEDHYTNGGKFLGKFQSQELDVRNGEVWIVNHFEKGTTEEQLTVGLNSRNTSADYRGRPLNQEWRKLMAGTDPNLCGADGLPRLRTAEAVSGRTLNDLMGKQNGFNIADVDKRITGLHGEYLTALGKYGAGSLTPPAGALPDGTQPVAVDVGGTTIKVAPDVAARMKQGESLIDIGQPVWIEIELTRQDGSKYEEGRWVDPHVAVIQLQQDALQAQRTAMEKFGGQVHQFWEWHDLRAKHPELLDTENSTVDKTYLDEHQDEALDAIFRPQFQALLGDSNGDYANTFKRLPGSQLNETIARTLGLDKDSGAVGKVVDEIRGDGGDTPEVRVVPIFYVDDTTGTQQSALFAVKDGDKVVYVDANGQTFDDLQDFQDSNRQFSEHGKLVVPTNLELKAGADDKVALDAVKARNVSTMDKIVDPVIGIAAGTAGVLGLFPTPATPFLLGAAALGGGYLGVRAVIKETDYLQHGGGLTDGESLMNLGMVVTVLLPEVASVLRTAGLSGRSIIGAEGTMSRWQALRAAKGLVKPGSPLAATANDYMRSTGSLNRTARGFDWGAIGTGVPLIGASAHDLAEHGGEMSAFQLATALTGLGTGLVGTAAGIRGLVHTMPAGTPRRTANLNYLQPGSVTVNGRVVDPGALAVPIPQDAFLVIATKDGLIPVNEMAGNVSGHPDYRPGQDIVLMVCEGGTRENRPGAFVPKSYAGELGNTLGARVHAVDGRVYLGDTVNLTGPAVTELPGLPLTDISGQNPHPQTNRDAQQRFWLGDRGNQIRVEEPFDQAVMGQGARVRGQSIDTMHLDAEQPDPAIIDQAAHLVTLTSTNAVEAMRRVEPQLVISPDYIKLGLEGMAAKWVREIAGGSRIAYVIYPALGSRLPRDSTGIISVHKEGLVRGDYRDLRPDVYEAEANSTALNQLRNDKKDPTKLSRELLNDENYRAPTRQLPVGGKLDGTQELPLTRAQLEDLGEVWQFSTYLVTELTSGKSAVYPSGMVNKPARMKLMTLVAEESLRRGEGIPAFYSRIHAGGAYPVGEDGVQIVVGEDGAAALISPDDAFHFTDADDGSRQVVWNDITRTISPDDTANYLKNPPTHPTEFNAASIGSQQSLTDSGPIAVGLEDSSPFPGQVRRFVAIFRVNPGHHVRADESGKVVLDGPGAIKWLKDVQKNLGKDTEGKWSGPASPYAVDYSTLPEPVNPTSFSYTSGKEPGDFTYTTLADFRARDPIEAGGAKRRPVPQYFMDGLTAEKAYARYLREKEYYTPQEMTVRYGADGMQPPPKLDVRLGTTVRTRLNFGGGFGFGSIPFGSPTLRSRSFGIGSKSNFRALGQAARLSLEQGTTRPLKVTGEQELSLAVRPDEWRQTTAAQWGVLPASNWTILPVFGPKLIGLARATFFGTADPGWTMDIHSARVIGVTPRRVFRAGSSSTTEEWVNISTLPLSNSMPESSGHVIEIDFHPMIVAPKRKLNDGELDFFGGTKDTAPNGHVELQSSIPYDRVMQDIRVAPYLPGVTQLLNLWLHTKGIPTFDIGGESITFTPGGERRQQIMLNDSVGKGDVVPAELTEQFNATASGSHIRLQVAIKAPEGSDPEAPYVADFLENPTTEGLRTLVEKGYVDPEEAIFFLPENGSNFHQTAIPGKPLTTTITDLTGRTYDVPDPSTSNLWMIFNDRWSLGSKRFSPERAIASGVYKAKQKIGDLLPGDGPRRVASPHQLPVDNNILDGWFGANRDRADPSYRRTLLFGLPYFRYGPLAWNAEIRLQYGSEAPPVAPAVRDGGMLAYPLSRDGSGTAEVPAWFAQCIDQVLAGPTPVIPKGGTAQVNAFLTSVEGAYPEQSASVALFRQRFMATGIIGDGKYLRRADAEAMVEVLPGLRLDGGDPGDPTGGPQLPPPPQGPQGGGSGTGPRSLSGSPPGGWEPVSSSQSAHLDGDDPSLGPPPPGDSATLPKRIPGDPFPDVGKRVDPQFSTKLVDYIRSQGGIPFADYMNLALYGIDGKGGYYNSGIVRIGDLSVSDFITAPEFSKYFGRTIADPITQMYKTMGRPARFDIVEMGAGNGVLARDILDKLQTEDPDFYQAARYVIVERSEALIGRQQATLAGHPQVEWVHASADALPLRNIRGVFLSNELVDAFPVHRAVVRQGQFKEIYVTVDAQGRLVETERAPSPELAAALPDFEELFPLSSLREGQELTVNARSIQWLRKLSGALEEGYVITIDYGEPAATVSTPPYVKYGAYSLPAKTAYKYPGAIDITSHVDFAVLSEIGERFGLRQATSVGGKWLYRQTEYLEKYGLRDVLARETDPVAKASGNGLLDRFSDGFFVLVREKIGIDRPDAGATPVAYRGTGADIPRGAAGSQGQIGGSAGKDGTFSPKLELSLTPREQQARRREGLQAFLDGNLLYPADARADTPIISVSMTDADHIGAFGSEMTPHQFLAHDETYWNWFFQREFPSPLALDISNPTPDAIALAQRLSNISGAEIIVPRADAPTQWQLLHPAHTEQNHPAGTVEMSGTDVVLVRGSDRQVIDPGEHLGQMVGIGGTKTAFRLYDKVLVVYRKATRQADSSDRVNDQIEATQWLLGRGAPYVGEIHGDTIAYDLDAILMNSHSTHHSLIEKSYATPSGMYFYDARDVSLLNQNSLSSLRAMRDFYARENIGVEDAQFLIASDGSFYLHDFPAVHDFAAMDKYAHLDDPSLPQSNRGFIRTLDQWILFVDTVIARRPGRTPSKGCGQGDRRLTGNSPRRLAER